MKITRLYRLALLALAAGVVVWSCKSTNKDFGGEGYPPVAPRFLTVTSTTLTSVSLTWDDISTDESGFHIYLRQDTTAAWNLVQSVVANIRQAAIDSLSPGTTYYFHVTSFNQYGESDPSDERTATTSTNDLPNPPRNVHAVVISETLVQITWTDGGALDNFIIQRHDTLDTTWVQIGSVPDNVVQFNDSTVLPESKYYYRVGAHDTVGTSWSENIDSVTTPLIGVPVAPIDLTANVVIGFGAILVWRDLSSNETGFEIFRNLFGQAGEIIDTVPANTTTYTDTLGTNVGQYAYRVRAFNEAGSSEWSNFANADYRYISRGIIPIALGNWWEYSVDSNHTQYSTTRSIYHAVFHNAQDFYLVGERRGSSIVDSLYYLRNDTDDGCVMLHFPLSDSDNPQLLFRYPAVMLQDSYFVDGQKVEVVVASPGTSIAIGDSVYNHVLVYDRFLASDHWIRYYIKPETIGIIKEVEYTGFITNPQIAATRELRNRQIIQ